MRMYDDTEGFGVGRVWSIDGQRFDVQFYSNWKESLKGPFKPCWLNENNEYYVGPRRTNSKPMLTSTHYGGLLTQDKFAAVGFQLLNSGKLPAAVIGAMLIHPEFKWAP